MEYFIIYAIGFTMGALCVASAERLIEKYRKYDKK
jgi:hypothetical protein